MDVLRIALALAVVRTKPPAQSIYAYILDLRSAFSSCNSTATQWRAHALSLEEKCAGLQRDLERAQIHPTGASEAAPKTKKKNRMHDAQGTEGAGPGFVSTAVFGALDGFWDAACLVEQGKIPLAVFISATSRIIDEMGISVRKALEAAAPLGLLDSVETALRLVVERALGIILARAGRVDAERVLERVLVRVMTPLVQSFLRLSEEWLCVLRSGSGDQTEAIDRRPRVLLMVKKTMQAVCEQGILIMRDWMTLEVLRQLEEIICTSAGLTTGAKEARVQRLVASETIWYLCSVMDGGGGRNETVTRAIEKKYVAILGRAKCWAQTEGKKEKRQQRHLTKLRDRHSHARAQDDSGNVRAMVDRQ